MIAKAMKRGLAGAMYSCGAALLEAGHSGLALSSFAGAARFEPSDPDYHYAVALAARDAGDRDRAVRHCERALELAPDMEVASDLLFAMFLHGEGYFELLGRIHRHLAPRTYVEIGIEAGSSLKLVAPQTRTLGVDPDPQIQFALPPNVRVFAETSDEFFAKRDLGAELGGLPVDLAFIDGMHHFEFALRDFMNVERLCTPESTILIHDCFPHNRRTAQRERATAFWSGDVWRLVLLLKKYRPDLRIHTVATPPTGLAIVRNLDPASRVIESRLDALCEEFLALDYGFLEEDRAGKLNLFPNQWERIRELLPREA
jgi:hypothetical protein